LVSALPALTKEFMGVVKQDFYLYATDRFLLKANDYLKQSTSAVVVEEVRAINKADAELNENLESALQDKLMSIMWPGGSRSASKKIHSWTNNEVRTLRFPSAPALARTSQLNFYMDQQEYLKDKIKDLRVRLDSLRAERDEQIELQKNLFTSGVPLQDDRFENSRLKISTLDTMITAHEVEFAVLREKLHTAIAHQEALFNDEGDE
jgi:hypothetical protein